MERSLNFMVPGIAGVGDSGGGADREERDVYLKNRWEEREMA